MTEIVENRHGVLLEHPPEEASEDRRWYAVRTSSRQEKKTELVLREKRIGTFLPLVSSLRRWSDRRRLISLPLFSGYVFVHIPLNRSVRVSVLRCSGVLGFVGNRGLGTPLADQQIETIRTVIDSGTDCCAYPFLVTGQRVRIASGSLSGTEGVLLSQGGDNSVVISLDLIQKAMAVRVTGYRIVPV